MNKILLHHALAAVFLCATLAAGCGKENSSDTQATPTTPTTPATPATPATAGFKQQTSAAITFSSLIVHGDPAVLHDESASSKYQMWFSGVRPGIPYLDIFVATSGDAVTWTANESKPVLEHGSSGTWDSDGVETPFVVKGSSSSYLYYTGYASREDLTVHHIGRATWNGSAWVKDKTNSYVSIPTSSFELEPNVVYQDGKFKMWYFGATASKLAIFYTESADGLTAWSNPVSTFDWDVSYGGPSPVVFRRSSGVYEMYFSKSPEAKTGETIKATSANGMSWTLSSVVLKPTGTGSFDSAYANAPCVLEGANGKLKLWYSGWKNEAPGGPTEHAVGLANEE